jgi:hypothetical protein
MQLGPLISRDEKLEVGSRNTQQFAMVNVLSMRGEAWGSRLAPMESKESRFKSPYRSDSPQERPPPLTAGCEVEISPGAGPATHSSERFGDRLYVPVGRSRYGKVFELLRAARASQFDFSIEAMWGEQLSAPVSTGLGDLSIDLVLRFGCGRRGSRGP